LVQVWTEILGLPSIGVRDNFFDLGGNSLLTIRMLSTLEHITGRRLPSSCLFEAPTIEHLANRLRQPDCPVPRSILVKIQPHGTRPPFFCVHGAGGGVLWYKELAHLLGPNQPFYGIESPGLKDREEPDLPLEALASSYLESVRSVQASGPYALGGYSMGGVVAFEMARQLQAQGESVALLAILDAWSPGSHLPFFSKSLRLIGRFIQLDRQPKVVFLREKWAWIKLILREYSLLGIWNPQVRQLRQLRRTNVQASRAYVPQVYAGKLTLFRAQKQHATAASDPQLGWGRLVTGGIEIHDIPGDHYTMFTSPHIHILGQQLGACLQASHRPISTNGPKPSSGHSS
jgi:thioesterase domain-containing protein